MISCWNILGMFYFIAAVILEPAVKGKVIPCEDCSTKLRFERADTGSTAIQQFDFLEELSRQDELFGFKPFPETKQFDFFPSASHDTDALGSSNNALESILAKYDDNEFSKDGSTNDLNMFETLLLQPNNHQHRGLNHAVKHPLHKKRHQSTRSTTPVTLSPTEALRSTTSEINLPFVDQDEKFVCPLADFYESCRFKERGGGFTVRLCSVNSKDDACVTRHHSWRAHTDCRPCCFHAGARDSQGLPHCNTVIWRCR